MDIAIFKEAGTRRVSALSVFFKLVFVPLRKRPPIIPYCATIPMKYNGRVKVAQT